MGFVEVARRGEAAVLTLNRGATNPLNLQLVNQVAEKLQAAQADPNVRSVVLASSNHKFFSIGFDLPELLQLDRKGFSIFYQAFNRVCLDLCTLPKPVVAAITGHAIAGGCILALCCDYRFIARGRKLMGLNEVKLGIPVPYPGDRMLRQIVGELDAREIMGTGEFYDAQASLGLRMVDQVLPVGQVLPQAVQKAQFLGALPRQAFKAIKRNRVEAVEAGVREQLAEKEQLFIDCWFSAEAQALLREAAKKF